MSSFSFFKRSANVCNYRCVTHNHLYRQKNRSFFIVTIMRRATGRVSSSKCIKLEAIFGIYYALYRDSANCYSPFLTFPPIVRHYASHTFNSFSSISSSRNHFSILFTVFPIMQSTDCQKLIRRCLSVIISA